ncbi:MAG: OmpA family protein [Bacteroidales bacterium]|nr:OmpA family protein [Bacteroidales bacterium]MBN2748979.1 OmpA family protein [Bacteroidales bacterium]
MKKIILLLLLIWLGVVLATAQVVKSSTSAVYVDSTGQSFVQVDQPVYFFVAPQDQPDSLVLIPSSDSQSNPMYFDGDGVHYLVYRNPSTGEKIPFRILADGVAPKPRILFKKGLMLSIGNRYYVDANTNAIAIAGATDKRSGVKAAFASVDGAPFSASGAEMQFSSSKAEYSVSVYAQDNVGNFSDTLAFRVITAVDSVVKIDNIYFDTNSAKLKDGVIPELDSLAKVLREYPEIRLELRAHTDSQGNDTYNLTLSERRAQSVFRYLQSKGIAAYRMVPKGYGETMPVNGCDNGVQCTPQQLQQNRRVEFKVLPIKTDTK